MHSGARKRNGYVAMLWLFSGFARDVEGGMSHS